MKEIFADTLIIGAGPAGISAAISLQKAGVSNAVVDRQSFPREKTCGGLITGKTMSRIISLLNDKAEDPAIFCDSGNVVELFHKGKRLTCSKLSERIYFIKRAHFDHYLVRRYKELGGLFFESEKNHKIDFDKRIITLSNGDVIKYKHLIAADGALSSIRDSLGYGKPEMGFCVETFIPKIQAPLGNRVKIFFGIIEKGYGWVFPSGDDYCIGLGGVYCQDIDYTVRLKRLLKMLGIPGDSCKIRGAFVPYGGVVDQSKGHPEIVLAGDAAGYVDPIFGEGLYFAITSGMRASRARIDPGQESFKSSYLRKMSFCVKQIRQGSRIQKLFFNKYAQGFFKRKLYKKNAFVRFFFDKMISDYKYSYHNLLGLYIDYNLWELKRRR